MPSIRRDYAGLPARIKRSDLEVNSLVILHAGRQVLEWYRDPYRRGVPQLLYSLSKSFTSIAVGIACDSGLFSLDNPVISFFPDKLPDDVCPNLAAMKIRHLLSMTAGHETDIYPAVTARRDWAKAFLEHAVEHEPGTLYRYSTPSTYMLSAIVERASGKNLVDFLMPTLFEPLGIARPIWETCPLGVTAGGMGLSLSTEDVAKFGQMLLQGGVYDGQRIVSEKYVELASSEQSDNRAGVPPDRIDSAQGCGFQFHLCRFGAYRGDGSFGQLCLVSPKHDLVAAANCAFPSMRKLQALLNLIFEEAGEIVGDTGVESEVVEHEEDRSEAEDYSARLPFSPNTVYVMDDNPAGLRSVRFRLMEKGFEMTTDYGDERSGTLPFGFSCSIEAESVFVKDLSLHRQRVATSLEMPEKDGQPLRLKLHYIETPYTIAYTILASECGILWGFEINVSFGFKRYEVHGHKKVVTEF